jgi:hypothetical protein
MVAGALLECASSDGAVRANSSGSMLPTPGSPDAGKEHAAMQPLPLHMAYLRAILIAITTLPILKPARFGRNINDQGK